VGIGICIREDHGRFVLARSEWITPITDVEVGEAIGLIHALRWAGEPQIRDIDFEGDCKRVVDNLYNNNKNHASYFGAIIRDRRNLLNTSLMNSYVKVAHRLAKTAPLLTSFHIHIDIPTYIFTIIMNKMR
jgi:ribonuclease HI